jgi:N-acetylmuramoyl-L-alanine amidase
MLFYYMLRLAILCCLIYAVKTAGFAQESDWRAGRTTDSLPYLEYGLGNDRLGGAKMTYLDTGIAVRIIDSLNGDYKVRLSQLHTAWLPKANFKPDSELSIRPYYLTGDWKVSGDEKHDYVSVWLDERLPYRSQQQVNPARIVIDVFGATSNSNWIQHLPTATEIRAAWYEQVEDDVFRIFIELQHQQHWGYSIYYEGTKLIIKVNRQPGELDISKLKIAVDAGHGGDNIGTRGVSTRIREKDYTLLMAKELEKALLEENAEVFMTRRTDTAISMTARTLIVREQSPDLLISIHLNSSDIDTVKGASTYYRYIGFRPLTQAVLKRMVEIGLAEFGNIGSFNFGLSGATEYPGCLVEVAFLSNREDERRVLDPNFHRLVALKIVEGIRDWLNSLRE